MADLAMARVQTTDNFLAVYDSGLDTGYIYVREGNKALPVAQDDGRYEYAGTLHSADALPLTQPRSPWKRFTSPGTHSIRRASRRERAIRHGENRGVACQDAAGNSAHADLPATRRERLAFLSNPLHGGAAGHFPRRNRVSGPDDGLEPGVRPDWHLHIRADCPADGSWRDDAAVAHQFYDWRNPVSAGRAEPDGDLHRVQAAACLRLQSVHRHSGKPARPVGGKRLLRAGHYPDPWAPAVVADGRGLPGPDSRVRDASSADPQSDSQAYEPRPDRRLSGNRLLCAFLSSASCR